jgi:hypothetical protein
MRNWRSSFKSQNNLVYWVKFDLFIDHMCWKSHRNPHLLKIKYVRNITNYCCLRFDVRPGYVQT